MTKSEQTSSEVGRPAERKAEPDERSRICECDDWQNGFAAGRAASNREKDATIAELSADLRSANEWMNTVRIACHEATGGNTTFIDDDVVRAIHRLKARAEAAEAKLATLERDQAARGVAPKYCHRCGNKGRLVNLDGMGDVPCSDCQAARGAVTVTDEQLYRKIERPSIYVYDDPDALRDGFLHRLYFHVGADGKGLHNGSEPEPGYVEVETRVDYEPVSVPLCRSTPAIPEHERICPEERP